MSEMSLHLRQVSDELATERKTRQDESQKGVSILRLHIPFLLAFATVGGVVAFGITGGMFVKSTQAHVSDMAIHADTAAVLSKGGIAYHKDVEDSIAGAVSEIEQDNRAALRAIVRSSPLSCSQSHGRRSADCKFADPIPPR